MKVLVAAASKHGATAEIAEAVGKALDGRGLTATVLPAEEVGSVEGYDAVVLGSGVYTGHWLKPAKELVDRSSDAWAGVPVWLFSSGPVGEPLEPDEEPVDVADIVEATRARQHRVFPGKIDKSKLGFGERAMVAAFRVPEGDFRDFAEIERWAHEIADALAATDTTP